MGYPLGVRKRVRVPRRAPDGSAFHKCDDCGALVPVALTDMHECQVKRRKSNNEANNTLVVVNKTDFSEEPRSAFQFFLESYIKSCGDGDMLEINRRAFEKWKGMTLEEKSPYISQEREVEKSYNKVLQQEVEQLSQEGEDEADSAMVGKFAQEYEDSEDSGSHHHCCWSEEWPSFHDHFRLVT